MVRGWELLMAGLVIDRLTRQLIAIHEHERQTTGVPAGGADAVGRAPRRAESGAHAGRAHH